MRQGILQACRRIEPSGQRPGFGQASAYCVSPACWRGSDLHRGRPDDPARPVPSGAGGEEVVLCLTLGDYLVEDIRQCMAIAEASARSGVVMPAPNRW